LHHGKRISLLFKSLKLMFPWFKTNGIFSVLRHLIAIVEIVIFTIFIFFGLCLSSLHYEFN